MQPPKLISDKIRKDLLVLKKHTYLESFKALKNEFNNYKLELVGYPCDIESTIIVDIHFNLEKICVYIEGQWGFGREYSKTIENSWRNFEINGLTAAIFDIYKRPNQYVHELFKRL